MPRLRINLRDIEDIEELDDLESLSVQDEMARRNGSRDRPDGRGPSAERAQERRQQERRRGKEIARHLRRLNQ